MRFPWADRRALAASFAMHTAVVAGAGAAYRFAQAELPSTAPRELSVDLIDTAGLAVRGGGTIERNAHPSPLDRGAANHEPRADRDAPGRGGDGRARQPPINLADRIDHRTLNSEQLNRFDRSQVQRIRAGPHRRSWDDRRATPNPMRLWLVSTGSGALARRLPDRPRAPSRGVADGSVERRSGSDVQRVDPELGAALRVELQSPGADVRSLALGDFQGSDAVSASRAARVLLARPLVPAARAAVPAASRGRPEDSRNSAQEVKETVRALLQASTLATQRGAGEGGQAGPGAPALDGTSSGASRALPSGAGAGRGTDLGTDPRFFDYFERLKKSVAWRSAFPRWAIARGLGGVVVTGLTVAPSGRLTSLRIVRSSGLVEFDRNILAAIREASFPPHPAELVRALGHRQLTVHVAWDATNPAVGREGPGPGRRVVEP